jgi:hypothetical protein
MTNQEYGVWVVDIQYGVKGSVIWGNIMNIIISHRVTYTPENLLYFRRIIPILKHSITQTYMLSNNYVALVGSSHFVPHCRVTPRCDG